MAASTGISGGIDWNQWRHRSESLAASIGIKCRLASEYPTVHTVNPFISLEYILTQGLYRLETRAETDRISVPEPSQSLSHAYEIASRPPSTRLELDR